ncbi:hypothetical protein H4Q26_010556 [Puccinia striiformis f. sp. tritici PST-130]|nr:hypothetical protein H4Q26_010556 [Puccinia striiformis f. sp. tritici PST-130]
MENPPDSVQHTRKEDLLAKTIKQLTRPLCVPGLQRPANALGQSNQLSSVLMIMICILILLILITISSLPLGMWTCGAWAKALATKGKAQAVDHGLAALTHITPRKHDGILDTLLHNDIDNYQMLESLSIDSSKPWASM